ncbi:retron St85 family RNA-directed DNA polymerase [Shewanella sp. NKUCC01_JLK]|uniref:retron St85 family RNA-directed DNA polymerase n=1 Tax=Shewanella sp. NKUCC01_JLK TaxID=2842123 RepID=UPI001C5B697E|nr:retron St85 family RNA-directed DNA polymerase [Shewanella sp. NKUCC01_JLK]MBW3513201.1 retron St85 family RNA-directed DNA polymerase [Shewanella sp. NKUCC01_JLK]
MEIISDLAEELNVSIIELINQMQQAPKKYKVYSIKKRSGGSRIIAQPTAFVKMVQKGLCTSFLSQFKYSNSAMAYVKERSPISNANVHVGAKLILKLDFENFFPSIKAAHFIEFLERNKVTLESLEIDFLIRYLFRKVKGSYELSIGAPSSPLISNVMMYDFDLEIEEALKDSLINYTRYADDLTFSANSFEELNEAKLFVEAVILSKRYSFLKINEDKSKIIGRGRSQRVTGITLTHDSKISIGKSLRKRIRGMLHLYNQKKLKKNDIPYLHGIISHMRSVEPDYFKKLIDVYGAELFSRLARQSFMISKETKMKLME